MKHIKKTFFFVLIFSVLFWGGCAFGTSGERDQAPGGDVQEEEAQRAGQFFEKACPDAEVMVLSGGQPVYYYIISME